MEKKVLSGIERELVLQYLIDGNVPVTVTPYEEESENHENAIHPLSSMIFPVALKAEQISVLKEGIILLKNAPKNVENFLGKKVRVEFYFNSVGLFFISEMKSVKAGLALVIPKEINRIEDVKSEQKYDFTAKIFTTEDTDSSSLPCVPSVDISVFSRPAWASIPLEKQQKAKDYLEKFVLEAKKSGNAGNGLQLINICHFMILEKNDTVQAVKDKLKPFDILFLNHERFVFGFEKNDSFEVERDDEFKVRISFSLISSPMITRDIQSHIKVSNVYKNDDEDKIAADCVFLDLKEEDMRFLYEKATSLLFI